MVVNWEAAEVRTGFWVYLLIGWAYGARKGLLSVLVELVHPPFMLFLIDLWFFYMLHKTNNGGNVQNSL